VFERAVLTRQCGCAQAERFCIAEREGVSCRSAEGHARCDEFVDIVREKARFALKAAVDEHGRVLPYGKAMRVQVGGLRGLQHVLESTDGDADAAVEDVDGLIRRAIAAYGSLAALPFSRIMPYIAAYKGRKRARRRHRRN